MVASKIPQIKNFVALSGPYGFMNTEYYTLNELLEAMTKPENYQSGIEEWGSGNIVSLINTDVSDAQLRETLLVIQTLAYRENPEEEPRSAKIQLALTQALVNNQKHLVIDGEDVTLQNFYRFLDYFFNISRNIAGVSLITDLEEHGALSVFASMAPDSLLGMRLKKIKELWDRYHEAIAEYLYLTEVDLEGALVGVEEGRLQQAEWVVKNFEAVKHLAETRGLELDKARVIGFLLKHQKKLSIKNIGSKVKKFKSNFFIDKKGWGDLYQLENPDDREALLLLTAPAEILIFRKRYGWRHMFFAGALVLFSIIGLLTLPYLILSEDATFLKNLLGLGYFAVIGGEKNDVAVDVLPSPDGGWVVGGYTSSVGFGGNDFLLFKIDSEGYLKWSTSVGGGSDDHINVLTMVETSDGQPNYVLGGLTTLTGGNNLDYSIDSALVKISYSGEVLWKKVYNFGENDEIIGATEINDGELVVTGSSRAGGGKRMVFIARISYDGEILWERKLSDFFDGYGVTVWAGRDKIILFANVEGASGGRDTMIVFFDYEGNLLWEKRYSDIELTSQKQVLSVADGLLWVGSKNNWEESIAYVDIYKIDNEGNSLWSTRVSDKGVLLPVSLTLIPGTGAKKSYLLMGDGIDEARDPRIVFIKINDGGEYQEVGLGEELKENLEIKNSTWAMLSHQEMILVGADDLNKKEERDIWFKKFKLASDN